MIEKKPFAPQRFASRKMGKPKDNLTLDAMDAEAAGMSYGQYKAIHPVTKTANEPRLAAKKPTRVVKVYKFICGRCGCKFTTENPKRRYCSDGCKAKNDGKTYRTKAKKKEA